MEIEMSNRFRYFMLVLFLLFMGSLCCFADTASITITGAERMVSGAWDSGNITISIADSAGNNYTEIVAYGQFSTPASIASAFAAMLTRDYINHGLGAQSNGSTINL